MAYSTPRRSNVSSYNEGGENIDHRKRKRNRIRASCLNCYASKRKCDKQRPCTRCVRLGNTALCVYETDEPTISDQAHLDEVRQLRYRIVELEETLHLLRSRSRPTADTSTSEMHSIDSVHFRSPQGNGNDHNLNPMQGTPPKSENVTITYPLNPSFDRFKVTYNNSNHSEPEQMDISHDHQSPAVYSPSPCSSCTHETQYQTYQNDRQSVVSVHRDSHFINFQTEKAMQPNPAASPRTDCTPQAAIPHSAHVPSPTYHTPIENNTSVSYTPSLSYPPVNNTCQCLKHSLAFVPLVNLGLALRTSREALEVIHPVESDCELFYGVSHLENYLFSASPEEKLPSTPVEQNLYQHSSRHGMHNA